MGVAQREQQLRRRPDQRLEGLRRRRRRRYRGSLGGAMSETYKSRLLCLGEAIESWALAVEYDWF